MSDAPDDNSGRVGLIGKTLGRYRITAELGRGGMATVYRAFDPQLGRDVAVKVMHLTFTGRGDIERRFRREAQAVAAIKHESIVDIFDFAPGGDGEPGYIVTELIQGPTLRELMNDCGGRILPEVALLIGVRVAGALAAAHSHGIIHRDVKPDNVMIDCRPGAPVRVLLTDFGVARIVEDDTMTATGSILGSPAYMSPEQARGHDVALSSDVFSFGALLYHVVTGRPPFPGKDPLAVIAGILGGEIPRPSQIQPHVGPALEAIILRCLKRAPAERYADASLVHAALRALMQEAGVGVDPDGGGDGLRAFFDDRDRFLRAVKARVAAQALENARQCVRRGELARALGEVNRVFAYEAGHRGAEALLARINSRRRWGSVGRYMAVAVLLAGGGAAAAKVIASRRTAPAQAPAPMVAAPVAASTVARAEPAPGIDVVPPAAAAVTATATATAIEGSPVKKTGPNRRTERRAPLARGNRPAAMNELPGAASPASPISAGAAPSSGIEPSPAAESKTVDPPPRATNNEAPGPPTTPSPGAATAASSPASPSSLATASLVLRASQGFCSPSVDEQPAKVRPVYEQLAAGPHKIFCTLPGGAKHLAGTYQLLPGTRPNLVVIPGPDGVPILARPQ
ncbi:MAG TPA: serine/threonine-protein kinase [Polyangia bacterium]|nr:serine/threonine-protein kinase [Polyangia bacterium]